MHLEFSRNKMCNIRQAILSGDRSCFYLIADILTKVFEKCSWLVLYQTYEFCSSGWIGLVATATKKTRSGSRWHAIANPHASGRNCPCTTQHSFKQPGKILLVCYSTHHSLQFDMPHDHVMRNLIFDLALPPKSHPKGCSWGHKVNPVQYVLHLSLLSICAHFRIKIFKIDFEIGNC